MKRILIGVILAVACSVRSSADPFRVDRTPEIVFFFPAGGHAAGARLVTTTGIGSRVSMDIEDVDGIRLVPGSDFRIRVIADPTHSLDNINITVWRNITSDADARAVRAQGGGSTRTEDTASGITVFTYSDLVSLEPKWSASPVNTGIPGVIQYVRRDQSTGTLEIRDTLRLRVPRDGKVKIKVEDRATSTAVEANVLPAVLWDFGTAFQPYFVTGSGHGGSDEPDITRVQFGIRASTPIVKLGAASLDAVLVVKERTDADKDGIFVGPAFTLPIFLGSRYKTSGRQFFGFPLRIDLSVGVRGLNFETHQLGKMRPFIGFGIAIPLK